MRILERLWIISRLFVAPLHKVYVVFEKHCEGVIGGNHMIKLQNSWWKRDCDLHGTVLD